MQPCKGALYRPTDRTQTGAVGGAAAGNDWCDAASADQPAVLVVVVAAVGVEPSGTAPGAADPATDDGQGIQQRDELGDVVAVATSEYDRQGCSGGIGDQMML